MGIPQSCVEDVRQVAVWIEIWKVSLFLSLGKDNLVNKQLEMKLKLKVCLDIRFLTHVTNKKDAKIYRHVLVKSLYLSSVRTWAQLAWISPSWNSWAAARSLCHSNANRINTDWSILISFTV